MSLPQFCAHLSWMFPINEDAKKTGCPLQPSNNLWWQHFDSDWQLSSAANSKDWNCLEWKWGTLCAFCCLVLWRPHQNNKIEHSSLLQAVKHTCVCFLSNPSLDLTLFEGGRKQKCSFCLLSRQLERKMVFGNKLASFWAHSVDSAPNFKLCLMFLGATCSNASDPICWSNLSATSPMRSPTKTFSLFWTLTSCSSVPASAWCDAEWLIHFWSTDFHWLGCCLWSMHTISLTIGPNNLKSNQALLAAEFLITWLRMSKFFLLTFVLKKGSQFPTC